VPRYAVHFFLPIRGKGLLFKIDCELLCSRKNWNQRRADLGRRMYLPVEIIATDMEAERVVAGLFAGTGDKRDSPPVENDTRCGMSEPLGSTSKVG
jgi:hypothetical protein